MTVCVATESVLCKSQYQKKRGVDPKIASYAPQWSEFPQ